MVAMKDVLTTGQVAKLCNVTIRTVIKWFENGHLEGYRIPGSRDRRFPRNNVVEFMQSHGIPLGELQDGAGTRKRLLLVDDDPALLATLEEYLKSLGLFEIATASNGYEAGLKTHSFKPHLLLIDYNLGDITGSEVAASIRQVDELKGIRIVVMSGFLSQEDAQRLLDQGIDDFLRKPFEMERARDKLFQLLNVS